MVVVPFLPRLALAKMFIKCICPLAAVSAFPVVSHAALVATWYAYRFHVRGNNAAVRLAGIVHKAHQHAIVFKIFNGVPSSAIF